MLGAKQAAIAAFPQNSQILQAAYFASARSVSCSFCLLVLVARSAVGFPVHPFFLVALFVLGEVCVFLGALFLGTFQIKLL